MTVSDKEKISGTLDSEETPVYDEVVSETKRKLDEKEK